MLTVIPVDLKGLRNTAKPRHAVKGPTCNIYSNLLAENKTDG